MDKMITKEQRLLSRKYLGYKLLTNLWFLGAIWLYFYRLFITDQQVGILDGMAFVIGLIAEVPSGALADRFGRDKMVKLGQVMAGCGLILQGLGSSFLPFFVGQAIMMTGISFVSGADEALFFSKINFDRKSVNWRKLITRCSQVALIGSLTATVFGAWLYTINPRIPWIITGLSLIASSAFIWSIKDSREKRKRSVFVVELKEHLLDIKEGFRQFLQAKFFIYVPIILTVQGLFYAAGWGLLRLVLIDRFHFTPFGGSLVIALSSIMTVGILALMHKHAEKVSEKKVFALISFAAIAGLLLSLADIGMWGFIVIFSLYAGEHVLYTFMSEVLNNQAVENRRATVLSVAAFLRALPYVVLAPIIGYLNTRNELQYFLVTWSIFIFAAIFLYLMLKKKDSQISLIKEKL